MIKRARKVNRKTVKAQIIHEFTYPADVKSPRAVAIMFDVFERLRDRQCFCGCREFYRVAANARGKFAGEYSLTLAMCNACFRLFHIV